jgi:hypothetical protein
MPAGVLKMVQVWLQCVADNHVAPALHLYMLQYRRFLQYFSHVGALQEGPMQKDVLEDKAHPRRQTGYEGYECEEFNNEYMHWLKASLCHAHHWTQRPRL